MPSIFGREEGTRWPRGQKFRLTALGQDVEARYQAVLAEARQAGGRAAFDEATKAFAGPLGLQPGDGAYLGELKTQPRTIVELMEQLQDGGATKAEVKSALDRLIAAKLAEPVAS
ncbi:MAG TPA: hypothetical protein VIG99_05850 [Myxococcaceae bacterium]|jgi:hypothetical protein